MSARSKSEHLVERLVTYTLEVEGRLVVIEHVPARVDEETGERFFAPETVERLQRIVWEQRTPSRVIETAVFDFAA
jgi:YgiT-type zinc finger domain-containing protein